MKQILSILSILSENMLYRQDLGCVSRNREKGSLTKAPSRAF